MSIKYIFSINSGRCGSDYLTELLSKAENTVSIHEGLPIMNGSPMHKFNNGDDSELRKLMPLKMREIKNKSKNGRKIYCETNHSFIKGWGYLLPDAYLSQEEIAIVILRREFDKTAYSLLRSHEVPGISEWSRTWYLSPNATRNLSKHDDNANFYDICKWYVQETYLRAEQYKQMFPKIKYVEYELEQLNKYDSVAEMFESLELVPTKALKNVVGTVFNVRKERPNLSLEELLTAPKYISADSLNAYERDAFIAKVINYVQKTRFDEISKAKPDYAMGGSFATEAIKIVTYAEKELEDKFEYSLRFTETQGILIWELLRIINKSDLLLLACDRSLLPGIHYTYNFNNTFSMKTMIQKLGWRAIFQLIWMMTKGIWNQDYTHRQAAS